MINPPAIYDHPYHGAVIERRMTVDEIVRLCGSAAFACALPPIKPGFPCSIWLPVDVSEGLVKKLRRHEIAHCNGWKHD